MIRKTLQLALIAVLIGAPIAAMAQGDGDDYGGGGRREMSRQQRHVAEPVSRKDYNKFVAHMFADADTNHDGMITLAEFNAEIQARMDKVIQQRFDRIDTNHDGSISHAEFFAWQRALGTVNFAGDKAAGEASGNVRAVLPVHAGRKPKDQEIARIVEPITADLIAAANTNYDAGMSLKEFEDYEGKIFEKADTNHDGYLVRSEIRQAARAEHRHRLNGAAD